MRTSKIVALVATAALLVVGTAFASFAAGKTGWDNSEGVWKYYKNGELVTNDWAKSGSDYYHLDENGEMDTEKLIDDDNLYYVDADGKMVKGDWRKLANPDDDPTSEWVYYYFQNSGKAYKATKSEPSFKSIGGKKYAFDSDGRMLWGWINAKSASLISQDSDTTEWMEAEYYLGDANDGAMTTGWKKISVYDDDKDLEGSNDQDYYFYFGSNGKKYADAVKTVDGKKYAFGPNGNMLNSLVVTTKSIKTPSAKTTDSATGYMYFSTAEDGARYAKKWFRVVPTETMHSASHADEEAHWFYAEANAYLAKSKTISWNGKQYAFAENGEMLSGLYVLDYDPSSKKISGTPLKIEDADTLNKYTEQGKVAKDAYKIYYFGDEETDGSMKTGATKVEIDGDTYNFKFNTSGTKKGMGIQGYNSNAYYVNGRKVAADEDQKYQLIKISITGTKIEDADLGTNTFENASTVYKTLATDTDKYAVFSSTGSIKKSGTVTDADGYKIKITDWVVTSITDSDKNEVKAK